MRRISRGLFFRAIFIHCSFFGNRMGREVRQLRFYPTRVFRNFELRPKGAEGSTECTEKCPGSNPAIHHPAGALKIREPGQVCYALISSVAEAGGGESGCLAAHAANARHRLTGRPRTASASRCEHSSAADTLQDLVPRRSCGNKKRRPGEGAP